MTMTMDEGNGRVAVAYDWAAGLIGLAKRLVGDGVEVDLAPIRPAVQSLCETLKPLPRREAAVWLKRLIDLQQDMAALCRDLPHRVQIDDSAQSIQHR